MFGLGKKDKKKAKTDKPQMAPLGYWEEESYMIAVPRKIDRQLFTLAQDKINTIPGVIVKEISDATPEKPVVEFTLTYKGNTYTGGFYVNNFMLPPMTGQQDYYFTEEEWEELSKAEEAVTVFLKFGQNAKQSFHLQLKLLVALVPDLIGVMDESAERMLCERWVKMAAASDVTPGPSDMYVVHAVGDEDGSVWLHTHGLCRCGVSELEIVASTAEKYNGHYYIINSFASRLLDKKEEFVPGKSSIYLGVIEGNRPVVATYITWPDGLEEYPGLKLGGYEERVDGHNSLTSLIFLYASEEDENAHKLSKVDIYDEYWENNPIFFFSLEETDRLRSMARDRFDYVKKAFATGNTVILKMGLPVDDGDEGECEHIWFELKEVDGDKFKGELTQEPYRVSGIHEGDEKWFTTDELTDWIVYTENFSVTPDKAYLLA